MGKSCFLFSGAYYDDVCAMQKLSQYYDSIYWMPQEMYALRSEDELCVPRGIRNENDMVEVLKGWFKNVHKVNGSWSVAKLSDVCREVDDVFVFRVMKNVMGAMGEVPELASKNFCIVQPEHLGGDVISNEEFDANVKARDDFFSKVDAKNIMSISEEAIREHGEIADASLSSVVDYSPYGCEGTLASLLAVQLFLKNDRKAN